jgi:hypothetical protein
VAALPVVEDLEVLEDRVGKLEPGAPVTEGAKSSGLIPSMGSVGDCFDPPSSSRSGPVCRSSCWTVSARSLQAVSTRWPCRARCRLGLQKIATFVGSTYADSQNDLLVYFQVLE